MEPNVHYRVHESPPLDPILTEPYESNSHHTYFSTFLVSHASDMLHDYNFPKFGHPNNIL